MLLQGGDILSEREWILNELEKFGVIVGQAEDKSIEELRAVLSIFE